MSFDELLNSQYLSSYTSIDWENFVLFHLRAFGMDDQTV